MPTKSNFNVDSFIKEIETTKKKTLNREEKQLETVYLNSPTNYGRYQIFPVLNFTGSPFIRLFGTREVRVPIKYTKQDGSSNIYSSWIKFLPKESYMMLSADGKLMSSLTAEEDSLLSQAYVLFDELFDEVDARNSLDIQKTFVRKKNYTIFNAFCLNKWDLGETSHASKSNFSALFVCTAKDFVSKVEEDVNSNIQLGNGDKTWLTNIYTDATTDRDGYILFSIKPKVDNGKGFDVTVNHKFGEGNRLKGITIPDADLDLMDDPIYRFLGSQANRKDCADVEAGKRRVFNSNVIKNAILYMSEQLAAIRAQKAVGKTPSEAVKITTEDALKRLSEMPVTNDPVLKAQAQTESGIVNPQAVVENNTDPATPPVAHLDPVSSAPVNPNPNPQPAAQPGFNTGFGGFGGFGPGFNQQGGNGNNGMF